MAKNRSRNSNPSQSGKRSSSGRPASSRKPAASDDHASAEPKADAKIAAANASEKSEILYQVKTRRTSDVIKAYITFTYRVFHPKVTARMVLYGLLILAPGFVVKTQALKIVLWVLGGLVVLLGLFRQYISLAITKKSDEDYHKGTEFVYEFTQNDASFFRDGELSAYSSKYKNIDAVFYDEDYFYLSLKSRELFVIPKDKFTIGDPSTFGDFMYKKSKKVCRWIPAKFSNQLKKMRSQRAIAREQLKK
jgi:hypothetical protein